MTIVDLVPDLDRLWVTADHHFGHANIIRHCQRPFTPENMDEELLQRWREAVPANEPLLHLGDLVWKPTTWDIWEWLAKLPGRPRWLVRGNHDRQKVVALIEAAGFVVIDPPTFEYRGWFVQCTHRPLAVADLDASRTMLNVHGHIHNNVFEAPDPRQINVCVELTGYAPVRLVELLDARINQIQAAGG